MRVEVTPVPICVSDITGRLLRDVNGTETVKHRIIVDIDQVIDAKDVHGREMSHHPANYELAYEYEIAKHIDGTRIRTGRDSLYFGQQKEPITFGAFCRIVRPFEKDGQVYSTDHPILIKDGKFVSPHIVRGEKSIPVGLIEPFFVEAWRTDPRFRVEDVQDALVGYFRNYSPNGNGFEKKHE